MPRQTPEPGPDDEQAAAPADQRYLDWQALLEALAMGGLLDGDPDDPDAVTTAERDTATDERTGAPLPAGQAGALAVEHMPPGPAQAGWLAAAAGEAASLDEYQLAGVAIAARRLASWAQAAERIDLSRARVIAEATSVLSEEAARAVEAHVLPDAGRQWEVEVAYLTSGS